MKMIRFQYIFVAKTLDWDLNEEFKKGLQQLKIDFITTQFLQNLQQMLRIRERLQAHEQDDEVRDKRLKQTINKRPQTKQQQWVNLFKNNNSNKLKKHILKFFLVEGHIDIAKQFAEQANIDAKEIPKINQQAISQRYQVVKLIKEGQVDEALEKIKSFQNGKMFDESMEDNQQAPQSQRQILFCLKSLKVINLIKQKKLQKAISQARKQLLPFTKHDIKYMPRIQEIMSLLVFPNVTQSTNYYLTTPQYRSKIAKQVNTLLLSNETEAIQLSKNLNTKVSYDSISELLKLTKWIQKRLEKFLDFPKINLKSTESDQIFIPFASR